MPSAVGCRSGIYYDAHTKGDTQCWALLSVGTLDVPHHILEHRPDSGDAARLNKHGTSNWNKDADFYTQTEYST